MTKGSPGRNNPNEDDAMFTKKPLGGVSCASCERNITNLSGIMADYQPWKKLPFRDNERIARVNLIPSHFDFIVWSWFFKDAFNVKARVVSRVV
jgi:hypothetical protein